LGLRAAFGQTALDQQFIQTQFAGFLITHTFDCTCMRPLCQR
jgi:hypothetical protein